MIEQNHTKLISSIFITFPGNCKKALTFYQTCFGGLLQFETFEKRLEGYTELPVVSGSLISDRVIIYGSDLVSNEGRKLGNYIAVFLHCENTDERKELIGKLQFDKRNILGNKDPDQRLIEVIDAFEVRWILAVSTMRPKTTGCKANQGVRK